MYKIKRLLVALDLSGIDETLINYVTRLSNNLNLDKIYFLHVVKKLELPEEILEKYPNMVAPMDESIEREIQFLINKFEGELKSDYEINVIEGNPVEQILKWSKLKQVDTVILGKKSVSNGHGLVSGKIAKFSPCTVIYIPEKLPPPLKKILVPIDFSTTSKMALELAIDIHLQNKNSTLSCLNIYDVPTGYHASGKSYEEFAKIMKSNAEKKFKKFIKEIDTKGIPLECDFVLDDDDSIHEIIYKYAQNMDANGIVIGSRGRTQFASILIGSVAEKLMKMDTDIPLLIAKMKDHNMDFMDALMKI